MLEQEIAQFKEQIVSNELPVRLGFYVRMKFCPFAQTEIEDMADNIQETRMDQVERYLKEFTIEFAKGMLELKASQEKADAQILGLKASQEKTDAQQNRTDGQILGLKEYHRQTEELLQKTIKEFRATQKLLGDLGLVQGEVAEDLFYRNVEGLFRKMDLRFERIRRNVKVKGSRNHERM